MKQDKKQQDLNEFRDAFTTVIRHVSTHRQDFSESKDEYIKAEQDIDNHLDILRLYMVRTCNQCGCELNAAQFYDGKGLCHKCLEIRKNFVFD